jgi:hypothetical protein
MAFGEPVLLNVSPFVHRLAAKKYIYFHILQAAINHQYLTCDLGSKYGNNNMV